MRYLWTIAVGVTLAYGSSFEGFEETATQRHGDAGRRAAQFLLEHMPAKDRETLTTAFLLENLDLAFKARAEFSWAREVPEPIFLNDVLPYAVMDEKRDPWRADFHEMARVMVKTARTASDAAQALNREFFNLIKVHYNTGRKRPNQSPRESIELGKATCTGLSIILVDACRAVGIPARVVGTPMWTNGRGNHTWVEIWDGTWRFTGADEYDPQGLDRGWFVGEAARAKADEPRHAIHATSWKREGLHFPLPWARQNRDVAAVNVTARYAHPGASEAPVSRLGIRLFEKRGGPRIVAQVSVISSDGKYLGQAMTKAGRADLNDMPRFALPPGTRGWLRFTVGGKTREVSLGRLAAGDPTIDAVWTELAPVPKAIRAIEQWLSLPIAERRLDDRAVRDALTRTEADRALEIIAGERMRRLAKERGEELERQSVTLGGRTLRWKSRVFGEEPATGRSLWISMHGGGNAPAAVNDRQWTNQAGLYQPQEGIYVAPRAPTDTWNLWHEAHIDDLFQHLIESHGAMRRMNPNRVFLMGYSAGGDGVWQLAPRMADRFAAAAMMAGHPNEASLLGLRNLPFALFVGANDRAYGRNKVVAERAEQLDELAREDPGGYVHLARVYEGLGHWMERKDAEALPWMEQFERNPWPKKVVWCQDDVLHRRFYWLQAPAGAPVKAGQTVTATVEGQVIRVEGDVPESLALRLSDALVNLDETLTVIVHGQQVFSGKVKRRALDMVVSLGERADPGSVCSAWLPLTVLKKSRVDP